MRKKRSCLEATRAENYIEKQRNKNEEEIENDRKTVALAEKKN